MKIPAKIIELAAFFGIDEKVATGLFARVIMMGAAPISSIITVYTLTKENQGLFYLFASLVALRSLFELGAGTSVLQVSAYARKDKVDNSGSPLDRAFVHVVNKWMLKVSLLFGVFVAIVGTYFLSSQGHDDFWTLSAWLSYLVVSVFQFSSEGRWSLLEGSDNIVIANKLRLRNSLLQYATQWTLLLSGASLFAFVGSTVVSYVAQEKTFRAKHSWLYNHNCADLKQKTYFETELITLIKRASQTYLTGYFVFQIQQPICFKLLGADGSAQLGFTYAVGFALISLPAIWVTMNFPRIANEVANSRVSSAKALFTSRYLQALSLCVVAAIAAWSISYLLHYHPRFSDRLMNPSATAILFGGLVLQVVGLNLTYWPRAFKVEPFVQVAYTQMIATPLLLWFFTSAWGLTGIAIAIATTWAIGLTGIIIITKRYWGFTGSSDDKNIITQPK